MKSLSGKRAVVAGIAGAHAGAIVRALRNAGAVVAAFDRSQEALRSLSDASDTVLSLVCDMTEAGIAQALAGLEERGHVVDILVTCPPPLVEDRKAAEAAGLRDVLASTVEVAFLWTVAAAALMRQRRSGAIVHVTGLGGLGGWPGWEAAGVAFAGLHNMVQSFAVDLARDTVRVNALVPGVTEAQARQIATASGKSSDAVRARIPMGTFMPEDALGNALVYLVHPSSSYVTGDALTVDGGWNIWGRLHAVAT